MCPVESPLLDGHLSLIVELLSFRTISERYYIGSHPDGDQLIKVCVYMYMYQSFQYSDILPLETCVGLHVSSIKTGQRSKRESK